MHKQPSQSCQVSEAETNIPIQKSILVVDDNPTNLDLVHHLLIEHKLKVRLAKSGQMALKSVKFNPPDLILLDVMMPEMDGYAVCEALKANPTTRNIPVIFLSANKEPVDIVKGFSVGGIDFVNKPFKAEILLARIDTHLTINQLQNELTDLNKDMEKRVEDRTRQIAKTNDAMVEEISRRLEIEETLRDSEEFHRLTLENLGDTMVITADEMGAFGYISPNLQSILGYSVEEVFQFGSIYEFLRVDKPASLSDLHNTEIEIDTKTGELHKHLHIATQEAHIKSTINIFTCKDITHRKKAEKEREKNAIRLKHALTVSNEGIWDWDILKDEITYSDTFFTMLDYLPETPPVSKEGWLALLDPEDSNVCQKLINDCIIGKTDKFRVEYRLRKSNNRYLWVLAKGKIVERDPQGRPTRFVGTHTDIQLLKESAARLEHQATYDSLTQLPNRPLFLRILGSAMAQAKRSPLQHAVLFLDLDRFKAINDSLGHAAGDKLLCEVSTRISNTLRDTDTVARIGGDEFTVLLHDIPSHYHAAEIAERIIQSIKAPLDLLGHQVTVGSSIGISIYPDHAETPEELLKNADAAMYCAKSKGGSYFEFFTESMNDEAKARLELEADLRDGMEKSEIIQFYQPKVSLDTGYICGYESLARWRRNDKLISPLTFIPLAEETGLIIPMGETILRQSLEDAKVWTQGRLTDDKVAVNISAIQFKQKNILKVIDSMLEAVGLSAEHLQLELTEAAVMEDIEAALLNMSALRDRGISIALDDFGTGYSSLSYLNKFPIDTLKIDMSFIREMELSSKNRNIVKSIIELAHNLNLEVVAEGVETNSQLMSLRDLECDTIQGYYYSEPLDSQTFRQLLQSRRNLY